MFSLYPVKVDSGQHDHFTQLLRALVHLGHDWASEWTLDQFHIKFGRIEGMSTRQGNVVFLRDILDEARQRTLDKMKATNSKLQRFINNHRRRSGSLSKALDP